MKAEKPTVVIMEKPREKKELPPVFEEKVMRQERDKRSMPKGRKSNILRAPYLKK